MSSVFFHICFLSLSLPVSHKYGNVLLCPDAEDSNLATTSVSLQLNQPIREQLIRKWLELELSTPTPAAAIQKSEVMTWIWFYMMSFFCCPHVFLHCTCRMSRSIHASSSSFHSLSLFQLSSFYTFRVSDCITHTKKRSAHLKCKRKNSDHLVSV